MRIKNKLKAIPLVYNFNSLLKAKLQERYALKELEYYQSRYLKALDSNISDLLRIRLSDRGVKPERIGKGNLNIFLTYTLHNWESVLPIALKPYGMVNEFVITADKEFDNAGFEDWKRKFDEINRNLLKRFNELNSKNKVDIVVSYHSAYTCSPSTLNRIAESGAVIFNFWWDDKLGFKGKRIGNYLTGPSTLASSVDLNLTNAPDSVIKYFGEGGIAKFWPEAAHPEIHKPFNIPFEYDVSVLGGNYGWRPILVNRLKDKGVKVFCFGNGWPEGPLNDLESVKLFSKSRINLGFAGVGHSRKLMCLKGRDFEVPMSGGLYLTQLNPELSLVFNIDNDIVTYKDDQDCYNKIMWLLQNPDISSSIRKNGRERALKDHTWEKRFDEIFSIAGFI